MCARASSVAVGRTRTERSGPTSSRRHVGAFVLGQLRTADKRPDEVFKQKVLKKLYAEGLSLPQASSPNVHNETFPENKGLLPDNSEKAQTSADSARLSGLEIHASCQQKSYTAGLPPADFPTGPPVDNTATESENIDSDETDNDDSPRHFNRRRARKKRKNLNLQFPNYPSAEHTHSLKEEHTIQTNCTKMSKNKKRKLKKKRQKEKIKAAGSLLKATCGDFLYQPEEDGNKISDHEAVANKVNEIYSFLQATKEIYFTDSKSRSSGLCLESVHEILQLLENRKIAPSDVAFLHQMKSLVVLQDTERVSGTLEDFNKHSSMPLEHRKVLSSLFNYWLTDILPVKDRK
ncbi:glutamate-rich protein 1 isoform X1 [Pleurodeles waltl]|uniref:glutamate-rich protein 1 isoform X1 n=1 Tax=Pleurodeles waltl TaxID=8319 RepID=UPI00370940DD